ncbi:ABC transporter ATP-binding protein [Psychrobacillus sp. INOP01]|uniref:ABC transporter ATP-binding protein n=1 Tax=Psychrobacillus sp. INOP01 TaxID=2829187 RepID=UPI001BA70859|nr:ABC transporter ATP-binding protein [Psychrobacillus sp. INOP01]QUG43119.1 ABC transporter ATP-binding protein [Psychrobacillus sp. INOP01]
MTDILAAYNVIKEFKEAGRTVRVLDNLNIELKKGEFVIIMGPSGSGKSTLLNVIGGLEKPDAGEFYINGNRISNFHQEPQSSKFRRENLGFVFQFFNLMSAFNVEENVKLPLLFTGESKADIKRKTEKLLNLVGLEHKKKEYIFQLSGGQQQRVAIARAFINNPSILLADEPTGNLDSKASKEILELFVTMKKTLQQSIIMVTHDPYVATYGDRVLIFNDGKILQEYKNDKSLDKEKEASLIRKKVDLSIKEV